MTPPPSLKTITIDRLSPAAVLFSYNQPHISNAFTVQQYLDLRDALVWAREEGEIKVIVQFVVLNFLAIVNRGMVRTMRALDPVRVDTEETHIEPGKGSTTAPAKCSNLPMQAVQRSSRRSKLVES